MDISAWIMFGFGCLVLYGGLVVCLAIALKKRNIIKKETRSKNRSEK